jgi:Subtilase family/Fervidolysin N-terminal prodomain
MGLPGRTSLARVLLLAVLLAWVPAPFVALAGAVDNRRTPPPGSAVDNPGTLPPGLAVDNPRTLPPGSATLPVGGPTPGGAGSPTPAAAGSPTSAGAGSRTPAGAGSRTPAGAGSPTPAGAGSFVPGRLLVGFEARAGERARRAAAAAVDGQVVAGTGRTGIADLDRAADARADARDRAADVRVVALDRAADVRVAARRLAGRPEVAFAEPDWVRRVDACEPSVCWHLQPRPGADVVEAHGHGHTGAGRTVAVVDTGVATGVADLAGQVDQRWRCTNIGCVASEDRPASSHGTEVASVVAALDDGAGTTGVAPGARIVSYRVDGPGGGIPVSYLHQALTRIAADAGVDVVNLSLGGSQWSQTEQDDIAALLEAGKAVVAAAGNTGDRVPQYPAAFPGVLSVGATDDAGRVADFSSFGKVDVVAPGECVAVAVVAGFNQDRGCPHDNLTGVAFNSGTSFAAPIVSGLLALADSASPLLARLATESSADPQHPAGGDAKRWAHGLVDAQAFVDAHDRHAPPALVLETTGEDGQGGHRPGSGDGQLPHPETTFRAYAFQVAQGIDDPPDPAGFAGAVTGTAAFAPVDGQAGAWQATVASGALDPGPAEATATATVDGQAAAGSAPVLVLAADDQAPGVGLAGDRDDAWRRVDGVDDDDLDDVYAVTLDTGDRLAASVASLSPDPVAARLFQPGTDDVLGRLDRAYACGRQL